MSQVVKQQQDTTTGEDEVFNCQAQCLFTSEVDWVLGVWVPIYSGNGTSLTLSVFEAKESLKQNCQIKDATLAF